MRVYKYIFACFMYVSINCYGQTSLPIVIPPSPQSKAFQKYGEYPVNYNTGIPDISIPLYTIKSGNVEVPITLRYYSSGIKPYDPDLSSIGSGWTLDYGGQVNRTIEGKADELFKKPYPMKTVAEFNQENLNDIYYLDNMLQPTYGNDSRYDRFTYTMGSNHGSFAIEDDNAGSFKAYPYPFVPYQIKVNMSAPTDAKYYKSISGIDIVNDNGIKYQFGHNNVEMSFHGGVNAPTGWYLEKISDQGGFNRIDFLYSNIPILSSGRNEKSVQINETNSPGDNGLSINNKICNNLQFSDPSGLNITNFNSVSYQTKIIQSIIYSSGHIDFNLDESNTKINTIVVYNSANEVIRTILFNRSNFKNSRNQYRLNSLQIKGTTGSAPEEYIFSYDENLPVADSRCLVDQWGYCRGEAENTTVSMKRTVSVTRSATISPASPPYDILIGDQYFTPNESYMKRYVLNKIQYPTGGTSEFIYESNKYYDISEQVGGGLRIKQIISKDNAGNLLTKTYEYDPGFLEYPLSNIGYSTQCGFNITPECMGDLFTPSYYIFRTRTLVNGWNNDLGNNNVFYKKVTEYIGDTWNNIGKIIYSYTYENPNQASNTIISQGVRGFFIPNYYIQTFKNWGNGLLKTKETYKNIVGGNYQKVEDITNNYEFINLKTLHGLYIYIVATYENSGDDLVAINTARNNLVTLGYTKNQLLQGASVNAQNIITGAFYLKSSVQNKYDNGNLLSINTSYEYGNPAHYYPTRTVQDLSSGDKRVVSFAYVDEFSSDPTYSSMKALNIISPVIEKREYLRNTSNIDRLVSSLKTNYVQWNNIPAFYPRTIQTSNAKTDYDTRITYHNYDTKGNIQSVSKIGIAPNSYLWGYNREYPIAEVVNAAKNQIAFSNCEEPDLGDDEDDNGSNIFFNNSSSIAFSNDSRTGRKSYRLVDGAGNFIQTVNPLVPGTYIVSYWSKGNGVISFDEGYLPYDQITNPPDSRGWIYHQSTINISSADYFKMYPDNGGNTILVDDIRIHPKQSQMVSYTYDPLIGMTSMTDSKNETTTYEYDSLQRLINIKDKDGNIVKHIDYHHIQ